MTMESNTHPKSHHHWCYTCHCSTD